MPTQRKKNSPGFLPGSEQIKASQQIQNQRQHYENQRHPLGHFGKLGVHRFCLSLGHEGVRAAGDRAGQARALAGLQQDHGNQEKTGEKLDDGENNGERVHKIQPFLYCEKICGKYTVT